MIWKLINCYGFWFPFAVCGCFLQSEAAWRRREIKNRQHNEHARRRLLAAVARCGESGPAAPREDDLERDNGDGGAGEGPGHPRPLRQRQVDAAERARRPHPPRPRPRRSDPVQQPENDEADHEEDRVRGAGRRAVPSPDGAGDAGVLLAAPAAELRGAGGEDRRGGGRDRGAGAEQVREHDHREHLRPRGLRRGEEAREHRARDAGGPQPADPRRADVGAGRDGGVPAGGGAGWAGGGEGEDGGDVGAPAVESSVPDVRRSAGAVGGPVHILREKGRCDAVSSKRRILAGVSHESRRFLA